MDDMAPTPSLVGTRTNSNSNVSSKRGSRKVTNADEMDDEDVMDEDMAEVEKEEVKEVRVPTMYRWISTSRLPVTQDDTDNREEVDEKGKEKEKQEEKRLRITFSVPVSVLSKPVEPVRFAPLPRPTQCAVPGCGKPFKYRFVKDCAKGACGITCLKVLEAGS